MWTLVIAAAAAASPAPVHLACTVIGPTGNFPVRMVVEEAKKRVTMSFPSGRVSARPATFNRSEIVVPDADTSWVIKRSNYSFIRKQNYADANDETGSCKQTPAPKKK